MLHSAAHSVGSLYAVSTAPGSRAARSLASPACGKEGKNLMSRLKPQTEQEAGKSQMDMTHTLPSCIMTPGMAISTIILFRSVITVLPRAITQRSRRKLLTRAGMNPALKGVDASRGHFSKKN